ncbi:HET-domain-containing protein [Glonium stellatum]|uniref:HET-domain-containing protein n=1 Tax=Glonium stellatum TaxID=574774 RepID=A0A8E2EMI9_9PEZI|nr:HET-domain-containing protein [Glonium stellatum]
MLEHNLLVASGGGDTRNRLEYTPLATPRSIRVVILQQGTYDEQVVCSFHQTILDDKPTFTALSYVWGDPTKVLPVKCNGQRINVRANLNAALRRLREESRDITIWVDALSINQMDIEEKSQQVAMMGDIYKITSHVAVYIGEDTENTPGAIELLEMLWKLHLDMKHIPDPERRTIAMMAYQQRSSQYQRLPPPDDPRWDALVEFCRRPYFSRVWVIQEVALAALDPTVICGSYRMPWQQLAYAVNLFWFSEIEFSRHADSCAFHIITITTYRELKEGIGKKEWFSLAHWLSDIKTFCCTDPRDRVYGLYGLATDDLDTTGKIAFKPDYHLSIEELYRNTAATIISQGRALSPLSHAYHKTLTALPSWVPDWTTGDTDLTPLALDYGSDNYRAASGFPAIAHFSSDFKVAHLAGQEIDIVEWCYRPFEASDVSNTPEKRRPGAIRDLWEGHVRPLGEQYARGGKIVEAFWRTLIANTDALRRPAPERFYITFLTFWREMRLWDLAAEQHLQSRERQNVPGEFATTWARDREFIQNTFWNKDQYAAFRSQTLKTFEEQGVRCMCSENRLAQQQTNEGEPVLFYCFLCTLAEMLHDPEGMREFASKRGCPRLRLDDPTEDMMDDQFIAEWFRLLQVDEGRAFPILQSQWADFIDACIKPLSGRSFFITSNKLMGIGPPNMGAGDKAVILAGSNVPFVLRLEDQVEGSQSSFKLLGEAYVHGVMDGSLVRKTSEGNPHWETYTLL